jgi:hypothetical protein
VPKNLLGGGNNNTTAITAAPASITITKSSTQFFPVNVLNYGLLVPSPGTYDGSNIRFRNERDRGNAAIANNEFFPAKAGICPLPASGTWWINVNTNIATGTLTMVLFDFPSLEAMLAMMTALQNSNPNIRAMSAPTGVVIGAASAQVIAANANRNILFVCNTGTTNGTTATASDTDLYLGFGAAAVVGSGVFLGRGQTLIFDSSSGVVTQQVNGISNNGNIQVAVNEGL